MNRIVTIVYQNEKYQTVMTNGTRSQCENQAFDWADLMLKAKLGEAFQTEKVELFFHEDARAQVLFQDIETFGGSL